MSRQKLFLGFIAIGLIEVALLLFISKNIPTYTSSDASAYVEAAHNFKIGKGLQVSPFGINPIAQDLEPLRLWPPGYPLLISLTSTFITDEKNAAILIPKLCFLLLPLTFFMVFRFFMRDTMAFACAAIISLTWPILLFSMMALTEIPFLVITLISFYLLFRSLDRETPYYSLAAGLCTALAIALRYIGYNIFIGIFLGLTIALLIKTITYQKYIRTQAAYFLGLGLGYLPMYLRNIIVFHTVQPYNLPPGPTTFFGPTIKLSKELACMLLGIWPSHSIYLVASIFLLLAMAYYIKHSGIAKCCQGNPEKTTCVLILFSYLLVAFILFAFIGPRLLWSGDIEFRFIIPHYWIIAAFILSAIAFSCKALDGHLNIKQKFSIPILLIIFFTAQFYALNIWIERQKPALDLFVTLRQSRRTLDAIAHLPQNSYIISNCGPYFRLLTGKSVRKLSCVSSNFSPQELADLICPIRNLCVILVYMDGVVNILPHGWPSIDAKTLPDGYQHILSDGKIVVLYHNQQKNN